MPQGVHLQCERSLGACQVRIVDSEGVKPAASKVPYSEAEPEGQKQLPCINPYQGQAPRGGRL